MILDATTVRTTNRPTPLPPGFVVANGIAARSVPLQPAPESPTTASSAAAAKKDRGDARSPAAQPGSDVWL